MSEKQDNPQAALILARMEQPGQAGEILQGLQGSGLRGAALVERKASGELAFSSLNVTLDSETLLLSEAFQQQLEVDIPRENLAAGQSGLLLLIESLEAANLAEILAGGEANIHNLPWSAAQQETLVILTQDQTADEPVDLAVDELAGDEDFTGYGD